MALRGTRLFLSRNLLPPDLICTLQDALRDAGAEICFCCNPSCNAPTDYHVLLSPESEKFRELRAQGCQIVGPQCILRCAKERKALPKQIYTCCLAMENFHLLVTGFTPQEKVKIEQLVGSMHGICDTNVSASLNCVIAKNVLTPKYKLTSSLRKPIVSVEWLYQCWREHRIVPFEQYRLLPFTGLTICATQIAADIRSKISEVAKENGGLYSADLTRVCTHLIANLPEGDKYKVAKRWGSVKLVNQQWFWQSIAAKVCLDEDLYPVRGEEAVRGAFNSKVPPSLPTPLESDCSSFPGSSCTPSYVTNTVGLDQILQPGSYCSESIGVSLSEDAQVVGNVEDAMESHGLDDMYLSECRIHLVGFDSKELRRLANMISDGGGTRYLDFNESVTHVIAGQPSDSALKDIRQVAVWGTMSVVTPKWLEECTKLKREIPVRKDHCLSEVSTLRANSKVGVLFEEARSAVHSGRVVTQAFSTSSLTATLTNSKQCSSSDKAVLVGSESFLDQEDTRESYNQGSSRSMPTMQKKATTKEDGSVDMRRKLPTEKLMESAKIWQDSKENFDGVPSILHRLPLSRDEISSMNELKLQSGSPKISVSCTNGVSDIPFTTKKAQSKLEVFNRSQTNLNCIEDLHMHDSNLFPSVLSERATNIASNRKSVFGGLTFGFAVSFPFERRDEIVEWIVQGGGKVEGSDLSKEAEFVVAPHGFGETFVSVKSKLVSSHWIKFCLNEKTLLDFRSNILYTPLQCSVPLPGFIQFKICVSQYEERDRLLLRNLCYVLGAKFTEVLNKKVTHLLCKFRDGQKYQAALTWGIHVVTADWVYQCVAQNAVVPLSTFHPKEVPADQLEAGTFAVTQFPSQAARLTVGELNSQWTTQKDGALGARVQLSQTQSAVTMKGKRNKPLGHEGKKGKRLSIFGKNKQNRTKGATEEGCLISVNQLDPWDRLTATWSSQALKEDHVMVKDTNAGNCSERETSPVELQVNCILTGDKLPEMELGPSDTKDGELKSLRYQGVQPCRSSEHHDQANILKSSSENSDMDGISDAAKASDGNTHQLSDVAAAIEDLLAQTSKVKVKDISMPGEASEDLFCSDSTSISRRNMEEPINRSKYKRPKPWAQRSIEVEEEPKVLSNCSPHHVYDNFQDSQIDSQVVGYDDHSGRQRIMERVRTRSMSGNPPENSGGSARKNERMATWKSKGLGRLFKAAEANK